jgi:putative FmdB family regulatory protein
MPLYEYACRSCGGRFEEMRKAADRLNAPACPGCAGFETMLVMSVTGKVGAAAPASAVPRCEGGTGGCCGGGACMH